MVSKGYIIQIDESLFKANENTIRQITGLVIIDLMIMQISILSQVLVLILKMIMTKKIKIFKTKTEITEIAFKDLGSWYVLLASR